MTNPKCKFYNWGGSKDYPSYPREYGSRCEKYDTFFEKQGNSIFPDCETCEACEEEDK